MEGNPLWYACVLCGAGHRDIIGVMQALIVAEMSVPICGGGRLFVLALCCTGIDGVLTSRGVASSSGIESLQRIMSLPRGVRRDVFV